MAIVELAHITLTNGLKAEDSELKKTLKEVKRVTEEYSKLQTLFYTQIDDPTKMFVISAWESKDHHQHSFDGSPQQSQILGLKEDQIEVDWMHSMDVAQSRIPLDAPVLAIIKDSFAKHGVNRTQFDQEFATQTLSLGGARHGAISAWNLRKNKHERDVRVNFSGWETIDEATDAIVSSIGEVKGWRNVPTELNFFFTKRAQLD